MVFVKQIIYKFKEIKLKNNLKIYKLFLEIFLLSMHYSSEIKFIRLTTNTEKGYVLNGKRVF